LIEVIKPTRMIVFHWLTSEQVNPESVVRAAAAQFPRTVTTQERSSLRQTAAGGSSVTFAVNGNQQVEYSAMLRVQYKESR
jgi:hypothetical protein